MPEIVVPFSNQSNSGRARIGSLERLVNLVPEVTNSAYSTNQDATSFVLLSAPGARPNTDIADNTDVNQMHSVNDRLFAWSRKGFYEVFPERNHSSLIFERNFGRDITFADGVIYSDAGFRTNQIWFSDRGESFIFDLSSNEVNQITDPDLRRVDSVAHLANYAIFFNSDSDQFQYSEIGDFDNISALSFATADRSSDKTVRGIVFEDDLIIFGEKTISIWRLTGDPDNAFAPLSNATHEIGCANGRTVQKLTRDLYWVSDDLRVYRTRAQSYNYVPISLHQGVEHDLHEYGAGNAYAYSTTHEGHAFYHLVIPEANRTWVYDEATELWHERSSTVNCQIQTKPNCKTNAYGQHIARSAVMHRGKAYIGSKGHIYQYDLNYYQDGFEPIMREATLGSATLGTDGSVIDRCRLDFQNSCNDDCIDNNEVQLDFTYDQGKTWRTNDKNKLFADNDGCVTFRDLGRPKRIGLRWRTFANEQVVFLRAILNVSRLEYGRR